MLVRFEGVRMMLNEQVSAQVIYKIKRETKLKKKNEKEKGVQKDTRKRGKRKTFFY